MTSLPMRDPLKDHLLTPKNAALVLINYQPLQIYTAKLMDSGDLINNVVTVASGQSTSKLTEIRY